MAADAKASHWPGSILVVEDNPDFCDMIQRLLELRFPDAVIETAYDGGSALTLAQYRPAIVVVDQVPDCSSDCATDIRICR